MQCTYKPTIVRCIQCGESFTSRATTQVRCPACYAEYRKHLQKQSYHKRRAEKLEDPPDNDEMECNQPHNRMNVDNPCIHIIRGDEETRLDFHGKQFPLVELEYMAQYGALPEGTMFVRDSGERMLVANSKLVRC
jgi:hypothetical protein